MHTRRWPSDLCLLSPQVAQETLSECQQVAARLVARGNETCCTGDSLAHALVPLPDVPYLSCVAQLPKPGAHLRATAPARNAAAGDGKKKAGGGKKKGKEGKTKKKQKKAK